MIHTNVEKPIQRNWLLALLLVTLLVPPVVAQADTFSFKLVRAPTALNKNSPGHESIRMTGAGTFDPVLGTVAASGTYTLFNAFDHPNGPIVHGTWHSTGFVSFTGEAEANNGKNGPVLVITLETDDEAGGGVGTGVMFVTGAGVYGPIYADEAYIIPPGGSGGSARFHEDENATFYPEPL